MNPKTEIQSAAELLKNGGLIAFPTDTVFGLGADAKNPAAMAKIYAVKNRPADRPLIVLIADAAQLKDWASEIPIAAQILAERFWPGALTLILPSINHSIGLRVPNHPMALALLQEFGGGIATTSANQSGQKSSVTAKQVRIELGSAVDLILDGECPLGIESTIVDCTTSKPKILRVGAISADVINAILG